MRPGIALVIYIVFVFAGAALISPWVAFALQGHVDAPFRRVVNRCLLVLAFAGMWPLIKALGFRSWKEIGVRNDVAILKDLGVGALIGSGLLGLAATCSITFGAAVWDHSRALTGSKIVSAMLSAVVVAFSEELLFRGAIFTTLRRTWNDAVALWGSSGIYAIVHFFGRPEDPAKIEWHSGFVILGGMLRGFTEFQTVIPGFLSLALLGIILALAFKKTGALWLSMGIHAAVVFWGVKLYPFATNPNPNANLWFWGTEKLIDGWFCFFLLAITAVLFFRKK